MHKTLPTTMLQELVRSLITVKLHLYIYADVNANVLQALLNIAEGIFTIDAMPSKRISEDIV